MHTAAETARKNTRGGLGVCYTNLLLIIQHLVMNEPVLRVHQKRKGTTSFFSSWQLPDGLSEKYSSSVPSFPTVQIEDTGLSVSHSISVT